MIVLVRIKALLGCPHNVASTGPLAIASTARPANWPVCIWSAQCAAVVSRGRACGVEVAGQATGVEGQQVRGKGSPSLMLKLGAGAGARLPRLIQLLLECG